MQANDALAHGLFQRENVTLKQGGVMMAGDTTEREAMAGRMPGLLALAGAALLVGAGMLLWWREGAGIFAEVIAGGLALCN